MGDSSVPSDKLGDSPAVELTGKIMVVAIIILFMVVVFVLFLHLYAKWFSWRMGDSTTPQHRRRRRRRRFVFYHGQDPAANYGSLRRGLEPSVLRSLPVLVSQPHDFKDGLECAVCLSEVVEGEKARLLPKCNHGFHVDCIDMWFQSHSTCPLCRNPVTSNGEQNNASVNNELSEADNNSADMGGSESPVFPTNVFIWGNQTHVSSNDASLEESDSQPTCSSSSSAATASSNNNNSRLNGTLVIDIPSEISLSSLSPSASRFAEDELKSPMAARLRSLKRLLSKEKRLNPCSPSYIDVEHAVGGQS